MSKTKEDNGPITTSAVEDALKDLRRGRMVILLDDDEKQGQADLCLAAEVTTPEAVNFMATHGRGLVCLALTEDKMRELGIPLLGPARSSTHQQVFGASIEARVGVTTGISAYDRAVTITTAVRDNAGPGDLVMPGHVHPLLAHRGGVLAHAGLSEGAVDLIRMAGRKPTATLCTILRDDGALAQKETSRSSPGSMDSRS
jgi:3,4-dihydroxy-2-butanone 4-phosphate synthase